MSLDLVPGIVAAVVLGSAGLGVPAVIARVPEPVPRAGPEVDASEATVSEVAAETEPPKELYAAIARRPGLGLRTGLASGLAAGAVGLRLGWDWHLLVLLPLVPICVALSVIDWRTRLLPTKLVGPSYVLVLVLVLVTFAITQDTGDLYRAGWGWLAYGGFFFVMWFIYPPGLGYGDVRLAGVLGLALGNLGWEALLLGIWSGTLLGGLGGLVLVRLGVVDRRNNPFGPYMVLGALVGVLAGSAVLTL
jgi:leader peptidase (prepilin peptidase)/N-methyltransferase